MTSRILHRPIFAVSSSDDGDYRRYYDAMRRGLVRLGDLKEFTQTESRLDYWLTFKKPARQKAFHLIFRPVESLYRSSRLPNFAFLLPEPIFFRRPPTEIKARLDGLEGIFTPSAKLEKKLFRWGVKAPIYRVTDAKASARALGRLIRPAPLFVDVGPMLFEHFGGVSYATGRLVQAMAKRRALKLVQVEKKTGQTYLVGEVGPNQIDDKKGDLQVWARRMVKRRRLLSARSLQGETCLFTFPEKPRKLFKREVGLLYDFIPTLLPKLYSPEFSKRFAKIYSGLETCDHLVAISRATREDARWMMPSPQPEISVAHLGLSLCRDGHLRRKGAGRREKLILVVSSIEPRKNLSFILDWFRRTKVLPKGFRLVWVGGVLAIGDNHWMTEVATEMARSRHAPIRFAGRVSDKGLCELYSKAAFAISASLYEGFGLPVLDALHHRTPILASFNSSLQELRMPGFFPIDPGDSRSLDEQAKKALAFDRKKIPVSDIPKRFSWEKMADHVLSFC